MVDREVFDRRMAKLEQMIARLDELSKLDLDVLQADPRAEAAAERWLHVAAECAIDLANHVIADRGWPTPGSYRESFEVLCERGVLDRELADEMAGWAGLRNVLVHMYAEVNLRRLHETLRGELDQLRDFAAALSRLATRDEAGLDSPG